MAVPLYFFTHYFFNPIKLILDYYLRQSIPSFYFGPIKNSKENQGKLVLTNDCLSQHHILNWLHTHFNFKVNFSCLIRNHLQSNLLRRNLFNRSKGAISVDFGTWYNNIVIMFGFFNFVIALVAIVFYTSNGQPL